MKRILISQRVDVIDSYKERRDALDQRWAELLLKAGCIAIPVSNHGPALTELLKSMPIDGILLSGGNSPAAYGGCAPERDNTDGLLISFAANNGKPLLGVCRGMQSIVLSFGGALRKVEGHTASRHDLDINRNVNSYHEYAPDRMPDNFTVLSKAKDGEVEYIRHKKLPIAGIMWHPERETPFVQEDIELIRGLLGS